MIFLENLHSKVTEYGYTLKMMLGQEVKNPLASKLASAF